MLELFLAVVGALGRDEQEGGADGEEARPVEVASAHFDLVAPPELEPFAEPLLALAETCRTAMVEVLGREPELRPGENPLRIEVSVMPEILPPDERGEDWRAPQRAHHPRGGRLVSVQVDTARDAVLLDRGELPVGLATQAAMALVEGHLRDFDPLWRGRPRWFHEDLREMIALRAVIGRDLPPEELGRLYARTSIDDRRIAGARYYARDLEPAWSILTGESQAAYDENWWRERVSRHVALRWLLGGHPDFAENAAAVLAMARQYAKRDTALSRPKRWREVSLDHFKRSVAKRLDRALKSWSRRAPAELLDVDDARVWIDGETIRIQADPGQPARIEPEDTDAFEPDLLAGLVRAYTSPVELACVYSVDGEARSLVVRVDPDAGITLWACRGEGDERREWPLWDGASPSPIEASLATAELRRGTDFRLEIGPKSLVFTVDGEVLLDGAYDDILGEDVLFDGRRRSSVHWRLTVEPGCVAEYTPPRRAE